MTDDADDHKSKDKDKKHKHKHKDKHDKLSGKDYAKELEKLHESRRSAARLHATAAADNTDVRCKSVLHKALRAPRCPIGALDSCGGETQ